MNPNNENNGGKHTGWILVIAFGVSLVVFIGGMFLSHWYAGEYFPVPGDDNPQALFGDSFGGVNALISAFAFAGLIATIYIQREELKAQRKDLELQRKEFSMQNETLRLQRFENTFFNMMSLQQQIVNDLRLSESDLKDVIHNGKLEKVDVITTVKGREMFLFLFVRKTFSWESDNGVIENLHGMKDYLSLYGIKEYEEYYMPAYLDHYFRHLCSIIKFVDDADLSSKEKYKYMTIVRATLSRYELVWLYYYGISSLGSQIFKPLIEKYSLLSNIRIDLITLCKENADTIHEYFIYTKINWLKKQGFSGTDYEFWITDDKSDKEKYYISAFYEEDKLEEGELLIERWRNFYAKNIQINRSQS